MTEGNSKMEILNKMFGVKVYNGKWVLEHVSKTIESCKNYKKDVLSYKQRQFPLMEPKVIKVSDWELTIWKTLGNKVY